MDETRRKPRAKYWKKKKKKKTNEPCIICAENIQFYAIGECNHEGVCSKCCYRMRTVVRDRACSVCKQIQEKVIVSRTVKEFESFGLWGDTAPKDSMLYDDNSEMWFANCWQHYESLRHLNSFSCRVSPCTHVSVSRDELDKHMRDEHGRTFCKLCLESQHFFLQEYPVYSKNGLKAHETKKGSTKLTQFHPKCQFCHKRYAGSTELYSHLERDHFKCHLCPEQEHRYYHRYESLQSHFRKEHFLCETVQCLRNRYIVFETDEEYQNHMLIEHGIQNLHQLEFNFSHQALPTTDTSWALDQGPSTPAVEDFPALPATSCNRPVTAASSIQWVPRPRVQPSTKTKVLEKVKPQVDRNRQLATALGIGSIDLNRQLPLRLYSSELISWGRQKFYKVLAIERRLENMMNDPKLASISLRPMPREERAMVHQWAEFYQLKSISYDPEPRRYVSLIKQRDSCVPLLVLTRVVKQGTQARAPLPIQLNRSTGSSECERGWEKLVSKTSGQKEDD